MSYKILGVDLYHMISWFIVYSFLGWIWESCYVSIKSKKWVNRGFVNGPFVTIYGFGAVIVYVVLRPLSGRVVELYFLGVALATALEYITGVLMEAIFHTNWWDYSDKKFNFQGKICLGSSVAWGFFTLLLFYVLQPLVSDLVEIVPRDTGSILICVWLVYYMVDFGFSVAGAFDLRAKQQKLDKIWDEFQEYLISSPLHEAASELKDKAELYRREVSVGKVSEYLENRRVKLRESLAHLEEMGIQEKRDAFLERYDEFAGKYLEAKRSFHLGSRRHLRAYPNLKSKAARLKMNKEHKKK